MKTLEEKMETKKAVANEIKNIFNKIKISMLIGLVWFIGFSTYNKLFEYLLFDYSFGWAEAEEILGYKPSQYNFVIENNSKETKPIEYDEEFLKKLDEEFEKWTNKKTNNEIKTSKTNGASVIENNALDREIHTGSMEITEEGRLEVKNDIISKLLENSIIFTFVMIGITFIVLMLIDYLHKAVKWTKKYAD